MSALNRSQSTYWLHSVFSVRTVIRVGCFTAGTVLLFATVSDLVTALAIGPLVLLGLRLALEVVTRLQLLVERTPSGRLLRVVAMALDGFGLYFLSLLMIGVSLLFYFGVSFGSLVLWKVGNAKGTLMPYGGIVLIVVSLFVLGVGLERLFSWLLLRTMRRSARTPGGCEVSSDGGDDGDLQAPITGDHRLDLRLRTIATTGSDDSEGTAANGAEKGSNDWVLHRVQVSRRFDQLQFAAPAVVAVLGAIGVAAVVAVPMLKFVACLVGLSVAVLVLAGALRYGRWIFQTPIRQLKLVLDVTVGLLGVGTAGMAVLGSWGVLGSFREQVWERAQRGAEAVRNIMVSRHALLAASAFTASILSLSSNTATDQEANQFAAVLFAWLVGYGGTLILVDKWRDRALDPETVELLYLRVFGDPRRSGFLVRLLEPRWRGAGHTACIAAPDVSGQVVDPIDIADLALGHFRVRFSGTSSVEQEAAHLAKALETDRVGVSQIYCHDNTWKSTLNLLLRYPGIVVLMDLRGFSEDNVGCLYELQTLVFAFPLEALVLVVDDSTDLELLKRSLDDAVARLPSWSPNHHPGPVAITAVRIARADRRTANELCRMLFEVAAKRARPSRFDGTKSDCRQ